LVILDKASPRALTTSCPTAIDVDIEAANNTRCLNGIKLASFKLRTALLGGAHKLSLTIIMKVAGPLKEMVSPSAGLWIK